jgi:sugar diacid utilization regulator
MDELKGKLFTANGYEKQALSELFAHIDGLERRLARLEKLTNGG